ncbi:MAG TPA: hypothetical protein VFN35_35220, partial [Ktedonobacteraceae bacterium]|nr:hypothetical protein [Ktedonobacteraceae bacterium]
MYSQQTQSARRRTRRSKTEHTEPPFPWSNQAFIAANQQRLITPEQRSMLKKQLNLWPAGCMGYLTFLTFAPILLLTTFQHHNEFLWLYALTFGLPLLALLLAFQRRSALLRTAEQGSITREQGEIIWQNDK